MNHWKFVRVMVSCQGILVAICAMASLLTGCDQVRQSNQSGSASETRDGKSRQFPKLSLHRPKSCVAAITRMKSLVSGIANQAPLPQSLKYRVREVIHGTGAAAHSHYYRINEDGQQIGDDQDEDHEDMESSEKQHQVEVDPYTELVDIARWLPRIAADADIDEKTWDDVKTTSRQIVDVLRPIQDQPSGEKKREMFRSQRGDIARWIKQLEKGLSLDSENLDSPQGE
jgi:hypothetical protein